MENLTRRLFMKMVGIVSVTPAALLKDEPAKGGIIKGKGCSLKFGPHEFIAGEDIKAGDLLGIGRDELCFTIHYDPITLEDMYS